MWIDNSVTRFGDLLDFEICLHLFQCLVRRDPLEQLRVSQKLFEEANFDRVQNVKTFETEAKSAGTYDGLGHK